MNFMTTNFSRAERAPRSPLREPSLFRRLSAAERHAARLLAVESAIAVLG